MKTMNTDVVVISSGTAGLPAAVTAAEGGARVIILEKRSIVGGTGNVGSHILGIGSRVAREQGSQLTSAEIFRTHMDYTHWRVDARLVKAFYDNSGPTIDWLEKQGVQFAGLMGFQNGGPSRDLSKAFTHIVTGGTHMLILKLTERAKELGCQILLKTPAKKILKEGNKIVGVLAKDAYGEEIKISAKAVIVATGGFGANADMVREYTGYELGKDMHSFRISGITGDGIRMAWEVGAARTEMSMQLIFSTPYPYHGPFGSCTDFELLCEPTSIMVNLDGKRFLNEEIVADTTFGGNAISVQKNKVAFAIIDEDTRLFVEARRAARPRPGLTPEKKKIFMSDETAQYLKTQGRWALSKELKEKGDETLDVLIQKAKDGGYKHFFMADSLQELCDQTGINLDGLKKTLEEYNGYCEKGCDELFAKKPENLHPIKNPRFFAARLYPSGYGTLGGIRINENTEVVDKNLDVIPGLYAAGVDANSIYGDSYTRFLYGNTQGFAVTSGHLAGLNALEYIKTEK